MKALQVFLFKNFSSTQPVSTVFGIDRGTPVDRYYIEKFLYKNKYLIKGDVLEVAESTYTKKFGGKHVLKPLIFSYTSGDEIDFTGDLETGVGITHDIADCFIMTQTLPFIFDLKTAVKNALKMIRTNGYLLITVPGITQLSRYDYDRWGQFWSFTDKSLQKLFEDEGTENIIETYGNVKTACAFLNGVAYEEIKKSDLDFIDHNYQVIISAVIKKK
jgi:hypothetical protein